MIEIPTVLILGAGASKPFGFPLGRVLLQILCMDLLTDKQNLRTRMVQLSHRQADEIEDFAKALMKSGQQSVDTFLEKRSDFLDIGKEAISCALVPCEHEGALFELSNEENWYRYLFGKLNAETLEDFKNNKISFITFNYDRSLEHFLFVALKNSYNRSDEDTAKALQAIPIVHVYGQLGKHPYVDKEGRPYGQPLDDKNDLDRCVAEIKLFPEDGPVDTFSKAHKLLEEAVKVVFLGFGYNRTNLERLQLHRIPKSQTMFAGTAVGLEAAEKREVINAVRELTGHGTIRLVSENVLAMLRKRTVLSGP